MAPALASGGPGQDHARAEGSGQRERAFPDPFRLLVRSAQGRRTGRPDRLSLAGRGAQAHVRACRLAGDARHQGHAPAARGVRCLHRQGRRLLGPGQTAGKGIPRRAGRARPADRRSEPPEHAGRARAREESLPALEAALLPGTRRSRPLQEGERHARPCRRRPGAGGGGRDFSLRASPLRRAVPLRWRGVPVLPA